MRRKFVSVPLLKFFPVNSGFYNNIKTHIIREKIQEIESALFLYWTGFFEIVGLLKALFKIGPSFFPSIILILQQQKETRTEKNDHSFFFFTVTFTLRVYG